MTNATLGGAVRAARLAETVQYQLSIPLVISLSIFLSFYLSHSMKIWPIPRRGESVRDARIAETVQSQVSIPLIIALSNCHLIPLRFDKYHNGEEQYEMPDELKPYNLRFPPWICQPYVRYISAVSQARVRIFLYFN